MDIKTYKKTSEAPKLEIRHDTDADSPRGWSNLGYFITVDRNYHSPDDHDTMIRIVTETGEQAGSQEEHIEMIKEAIEDEVQEKVLEIFPVVKYEHSGVVYSLGEKHGFDYSNNGFYIITEESAKELGTPKESFERVVRSELDIFNKWVNGEVYSYVLYNDNGEHEDSCGGFYDIEYIRESLPSEWEDEDLTKYLK